MCFNTVNVHELKQCTNHNNQVSKGWRLNINEMIESLQYSTSFNLICQGFECVCFSKLSMLIAASCHDHAT